MRFSFLRRLTPFIALFTAAVLASVPAKACSLVVGVDTQLPEENWAVPSNEVFKFWHHSSEAVSAVIVDGNGNRVPAAVTTSIVPTSYDLEAPFYSVLRPFRPLAAGSYELQIRTLGGSIQKRQFIVHSGTDKSAPLAPLNLAATLESVNVEVGTNADCSAIMKNRPFLVLKTKNDAKATQPNAALVYSPVKQSLKAGLPAFLDSKVEKSPPAEAVIYNLTWVPTVNGRPDEKRKQTIFGLRPQAAHGSGGQEGVSLQMDTFLIPLSAFASLKVGDQQIRLSLEAEDAAGNKSQPVRLTIDAPDLIKHREVETNETRRITKIPIDEELTKDLRRFREATPAVAERSVFDLIRPTRPPDTGAAADAAFKKGIDEQEGQTITIQGIIPAKNARTTIELPVIIQGGKVRQLVSKSYLQKLLNDLPLAEPTVEKIDIQIGAMGYRITRMRVYASGYLYLKGQSEPKYFSWSLANPTNIKALVQKWAAWRQLFEANEYYRTLTSKYGKSSPYITEDIDNINQADVNASFTGKRYTSMFAWTIRSGIVKLSRADGVISDLGVGEWEKPFQQIAQQLNMSAEKQAATMIWLRSDADSGFIADLRSDAKFSISATGEVKRIQ